MTKSPPSPPDMTALGPDGRCCGRKPIIYKGDRPHLFCPRCDRSFTHAGQQQPNWAWRAGTVAGTFERLRPQT